MKKKKTIGDKNMPVDLIKQLYENQMKMKMKMKIITVLVNTIYVCTYIGQDIS